MFGLTKGINRENALKLAYLYLIKHFKIFSFTQFKRIIKKCLFEKFYKILNQA